MRTQVATLDPTDMTIIPAIVSTAAEKCAPTTIDAKIMLSLMVVTALLRMTNMKITPSIMSSLVAERLTRSAAMATPILMIFEKACGLSSLSFI